MDTISARDIFYSYPKLPVDAPMPMYVEVGEYEALRTILQQWLELLYCNLPDNEVNPKLDELIANTKAQLSTLGNQD